MCQEPRRNSPSVTLSRPISSCMRTTRVIAASSIRRSASAVMRPALCASRASISSRGRRRLPTWSARNGGVVRCMGSLRWKLLRIEDLPRILDLRDGLELDVGELAVDPLDLADIDVLDDVAGLGVNLD